MFVIFVKMFVSLIIWLSFSITKKLFKTCQQKFWITIQITSLIFILIFTNFVESIWAYCIFIQMINSFKWIFENKSKKDFNWKKKLKMFNLAKRFIKFHVIQIDNHIVIQKQNGQKDSNEKKKKFKFVIKNSNWKSVKNWKLYTFLKFEKSQSVRFFSIRRPLKTILNGIVFMIVVGVFFFPTPFIVDRWHGWLGARMCSVEFLLFLFVLNVNF